MGKKKCSRCGELKGRKIVDPYVRELYGKTEHIVLCPKCETERWNDI